MRSQACRSLITGGKPKRAGQLHRPTRSLESFAPKAGSATKPTPGFQVEILDQKVSSRGDRGQCCHGNDRCRRAVSRPCGAIKRDLKSYLNPYPGYYLTGDGGFIDQDGYVFIMGRTDDVINVAGHRLSTGEMEEIVAAHSAVAECAVIGVADELKGQLPQVAWFSRMARVNHMMRLRKS